MTKLNGNPCSSCDALRARGIDPDVPGRALESTAAAQTVVRTQPLRMFVRNANGAVVLGPTIANANEMVSRALASMAPGTPPPPRNRGERRRLEVALDPRPPAERRAARRAHRWGAGAQLDQSAEAVAARLDDRRKARNRRRAA